MLGGPSNMYRIGIPISSLGQPPVLQTAMGPEAYQRFREGLAGVVTSIDYNTYQYTPELSFAPAN